MAELKRKAFHLLGLVYVLLMNRLPRPTFLIAMTAFLIFVFAVEMLRLKNESARQWFIGHFHSLLREKEKTALSGVFWLVLGVIAARLILFDLSLATAAVLYVLFGDLAASLVGKNVGGPHWLNSPKRISGSAACFVVCAIIGYLVLPAQPRFGLWMGAAAATAAELITLPINDNLLIPFLSAVALGLCFGF